MSVLAFDPVRARIAARQLLNAADRLSSDAAELWARCIELQLGGDGWYARRTLERAATMLWHDATFLALASERVGEADAGELWEIAVGPVGRRGPLGPWRDAWGASPPGGDLGGTFDAEARRPVESLPGADAQRARALLARLFGDLGAASQIRADEFGLVQVADDRFIVVLPGVTDLSDLDPLLSDRHRSVRDLDQYAIRSSRSTSVADNRYAAMVWQALETVDVPHGAALMIVGHSFGADTALDLASDRRFNGDRFRVTHVVAAGYHSRPQLADVVDGTEVLVVQNRHDLVVAAERVGQSSAADSVVGRVRQLGDVLRLDPAAAVDRSWEVLDDDLDALGELRDFATSHADDLGDLAVGAVSANWERTKDAAGELVAPEPHVERVGDDIVVDVLDGGRVGAGHHLSNYAEHLDTPLEPAVVGFLGSVGGAGYAGPGSVVAIDVSIPE
jgi:hypothetical protein